MKQFLRTTAAILAMVLVLNMMPWGIVSAQEATASANTPSGTVQLPDQYIRDPFILNDNGVFYLYGSIAFGAFEVFFSTDLVNWTTYSNPAFQADEDSWVNAASKQTVSGVETGYWAPEVFKLTIDGETAYYMIATFTQNKEPYNQQVSAIMKSSSPLGPFEPWSVDENGDIAPITPNDGCSYMDATLYYEDGVPYLVYVHEWQCSCRDYDGVGSMGYVQLSADLKTTAGSHQEWFNNNWLRSYNTELFKPNVPGVTDGPEVYVDSNGQKYLLWSTHFLDKTTGEQVYTQLATKFSTLGETKLLSLKTDTLLLYANNGGHGMIFTDNQGNEKMVLHTPSNKNARACIFDVQLTNSGIALETYTVGGTVAGNPNGTITASGSNGRHIFENALVDGSYSVKLSNGTYDLYFDCGDTDGMATVTVNGGDVAVPMVPKTYQKLTIDKEGTAGTANWVMTGNGQYEVQTSNTSVNSISYGYFTDGVNLAVADFEIKTRVQAAGSEKVMIGMVIDNDDETVVYGLNNSDYSAQIRVLQANGWPGYKNVATYDRTDFELTVVKKGETITYYIDGVQACQWTKADYDFTTWTNAKVGIGIYRTFNVTFSDYSYTDTTEITACQVSGTVAGNLSGDITVTDTQGNCQTYENALINGSYQLELTTGSYDLYFDCGTTEGMITDLLVKDASVTANLDKTYQKLTIYKAGVNGTADWVLTDNGRYEVQTSNSGGDSIAMGYFAKSVNLANTDFVIHTNVQAGGNTAAMIGLAINQGNSDGLLESMVFGLNNSNYTAQIRVLLANGWPGYRNVVTYDRTNYRLTILKQGTTLTYFVNGMQVCQWTSADYNLSGCTSAQVGIGFYRMYDVTFSDYSYSTEAADIAAAQGYAVTYDKLPEGVTMTCNGGSFTSGSVFAKGSTVTIGNLSNSGTTFTVTVNDKEQTVVDGTVTFTLTENAQIKVAASNAYTVSGTVGDGLSGDLTITDAGGKQTVITGGLKNGSYSVLLYEGVYSLYFDCGKTEGLIPNVTVSGSDVTASLDKTYQKLTVYKEGSDGTANWVLTDNGRYEVKTSNSGGNSISMGWFESGVDMSNTDFELSTNVQAAGTNTVMIGLAITGKNAAGNAETAVFGLQNSGGYLAQIRALKANGWPGYKGVASYDRTNFNLRIVKTGTTITYYINGTQACQWTTADYDFAGWTDTKIGLGFYRMYDVTFSDYRYYSPNLVQGTVFGKVSGDITATNANGESKVFEGALVDGSYTIRLDNGTYDLYFDCGDTEGLIADVVVKDATVTANLDKTYQKLTAYKEGSDGTANWLLTDNGRYEVQTSDSGGNSISMGWFAEGINMSATDFVMETNVEAAGTNAVMMGLAITGKNAAGNKETTVFGLNNSNQSAQIRALLANGWPGYKNVAAYDRTNFRLRIVKEGTTITYFINGVQACQWTTADYDFAGWTDTKIGLGFYRMYDVTFSDYSYFEGKLGLTFNAGELYETQKQLSKTPKTLEATVFFPANTAATTAGGVILGNYYTAGFMNFEVYTGGKTRVILNGTSYVFDTMVYTGRPEHIAVVLDETAGMLRCYQNGVLMGEKAYDNSVTLTASGMVLGGDQRTGNTLHFTGNLLSAAMFADARTAQEIQADMVAMPTDENLLAWYDLAGVKAGETAVDASANGHDMFWSADFFTYEDEKVLGEDYAYSFAVIGDTQIIARDEIDGKYSGYFKKIYDYVLNNKESKNIQFVVNLGDMTDTYGTGEHSALEWQMNVEQLHRMDGVVPYSFVRGNHDDVSEYNHYLPYSDYANVIGGSYDQSMLNTWQELTVGQVKYLILALDYGPSDDVLAWASGVIESHPYHNVIVTTHAYMDGDGSLITDNSGTPPTASGGYNNGDDLWEKLIKKHENIVMVLCGHVDPNQIVTTYATGDHGNRIAQLLIDPQGIDAVQAPTGMVAMFYFAEDGKTVDVEWFSTIQEKHYKAKNIFSMELDLVSITGNVTAQNAAGETVAGYESLTAALADTEVTGIVSYQLNADLADQVISEDMILDLNGHNLTNVTIDQGVTLQLIDSTTDDFTGEYGCLSGTIEGTVDSLVEFGSKSYFVACENGVYSAHRYEVKLTHVSLDPGNDALGYKAQFNGDETVCKYVTGFSFNLWVNENNVKTYTKDGAFENGQVLTLRLKNILAANGGEMAINANAFVTFSLEEKTVTGADYSTTMKQTLQAVNAAWYTADGGYTYTETQMNAVKALCDKYAVTQSWELNNVYLVENNTEPEQTVSEV